MENPPVPDSELPTDFTVTAEKAELIERATDAYFTYTLDCYDRVKVEGNNVLQWLFGVIAGGIGVVGPVAIAKQWWLAIAFGVVVARAAWIAATLIQGLATQNMHPPGNFAGNLNGMLNDTPERMRWRAAWAQDQRIADNSKAVTRVADAVDAARRAFSSLPFCFLPIAVLGALVQFSHP